MSRDRVAYLHLLILIALTMTVLTDVLEWSWLSVVYPANGVLLAAAGAELATLHDGELSIGKFYRAGFRRVLAPLWIFAAVVVPVLLELGWRADASLGSEPLTWRTAWLWLVPLVDPPVSTAGLTAASGLELLRVWLWFALLTPPLLWVFRRWPGRLLAIPVITLLLVTAGLVNLDEPAYDIVVGVSVYACSWCVGFAYSDGSLGRFRLAGVLVVGGLLVVAGLRVGAALTASYVGEGVLDIPLAALLVTTGAVVVLLRLQPAFSWLGRQPRTAAALAVIGRRTVSVVLWAGAAAAVAPEVLSRLTPARVRLGTAPGAIPDLGAAWALLLGAVVLTGWVEAGGVTPIRRFLGRTAVPATPAVAPADPGERTFVLHGNVVQDVPSPVAQLEEREDGA